MGGLGVQTAPRGEKLRRTAWGIALGLCAMALGLGLAVAYSTMMVYWATLVTLGGALLVPLVLCIKAGIRIARSPRLPAARWWWIALTTLVGIPVGFYGPIAGRGWRLSRLADRLPIFPEAQLIERVVTPIGLDETGNTPSARLLYETAAPAAEIARFYEDTLVALGWVMDTPEPYLTSHTYWYLRPGSWISVDVCGKREERWCSAAQCREWTGLKYLQVTLHPYGMPGRGRRERCRAERSGGSTSP